MIPARLWAREQSQRLLEINADQHRFEHGWAEQLAERLRPGDLLVVNDAATLPASFRVQNLDAELRLAGLGASENEFVAVLFGTGDYRTPTEHRPAPLRVDAGQRLELGLGLCATVMQVDRRDPRLLEISFNHRGARLFSAIYDLGRPIQYAHRREPLQLWEVQNRFASRPWAFEPPSAGLAIDARQLLGLKARQVSRAWLTHAAGISSTGSAELDARLPFPEHYEIPPETVQAIELTRGRGGRVIAVGTTVTRALEASAAEHGGVRPGRALARLRIGPGFRPRVVDALLTGIHEQGSSHFALLEAFVDRRLLDRAIASAIAEGYRSHELGDFSLIFGLTHNAEQRLFRLPAPTPPKPGPQSSAA